MKFIIYRSVKTPKGTFSGYVKCRMMNTFMLTCDSRQAKTYPTAAAAQKDAADYRKFSIYKLNETVEVRGAE